MQAITLAKQKVAKTVKDVDLDAKGRKVEKRHIITSTKKKLVSVGIKQEADLSKISGKVTIFDNDLAVIEIDKKKLATALQSMASELEKGGIKRLYEIAKLSVDVGYTPDGALAVEGDFDDLVFWVE